MDATQFQTLVVAWGAALTTLIGVLLGLALTIKSAVARVREQTTMNQASLARVHARVAETVAQLRNGGMHSVDHADRE